MNVNYATANYSIVDYYLKKYLERKELAIFGK